MLTACAVPNFLASRDKSLVATAVRAMAGIRAALASYASDHHNSPFPRAFLPPLYAACRGGECYNSEESSRRKPTFSVT
jgi:hypothetical protein